ncbi:MAG: hypothetical protein U1E33_08105 [Rhodospirillales bacterium]
MGIKTSVAALLLRARETGTRFDLTATIGRQRLDGAGRRPCEAGKAVWYRRTD